MAIGLNATGDLIVRTGGAVSVVTGTITILTGANRTLIGGIGMNTNFNNDADRGVLTATYRGLAMTRVVIEHTATGGGNDPHCEGWILTAPDTGVGTALFTLRTTGSKKNAILGLMALDGVDQSATVDITSTRYQAGGNNLTGQMSTTISGAWVVDVMINKGLSGTPTIPSGSTQVHSATTQATTSTSTFGMSRKAVATATSVQNTWTNLFADDAAGCFMGFKPDLGAGRRRFFNVTVNQG